MCVWGGAVGGQGDETSAPVLLVTLCDALRGRNRRQLLEGSSEVARCAWGLAP